MHKEDIDLVCVDCGNRMVFPPNTPMNCLCMVCGGSHLIISTDSGVEQYELKCVQCKKSFFVKTGETFNLRDFKHCKLYLFSFHKSIISADQAKYESVLTDQAKIKPPKDLLSLPFSSANITEIRKKISHIDKPKIGLIFGNEFGHAICPVLDEIGELLRNDYLVIPFKSHNLSQENWLVLNECDLVIGQYAFTLKSALTLRIPAIIIHSSINLQGRCEASLYGLKTIKKDELLKHIQSILKVPALSYCIVTHNRRVIAQESIEAVLKHKKANEDIIIVDNASTDGLLAWLVGISERPDITLVKNVKNKGCVLARNQAMRKAKGRYLLTLDSDQIISADTTHLMRMVNADIVGSEAWDITRSGIAAKVGIDSLSFDYVGAGGMMTQKRIAAGLDYFDERFAPAYYEDPDFCLRARARGYTIKVCDNHIIHKGPGMDKALGTKAAGIKNRSKDKFVEKWQTKFKTNKPSDKPRILFIVDVSGWAWDIKTKNIKHWLRDEYEIVIKYQNEISEFVDEDYDLYFAYDCPYVRRFKGKDPRRIIGGVTAHTYINFPDYKELLKSCGNVHANSMLLFDEVKEINSNAYYVPNGVDADRFKFVKRSGPNFRAGYVGKSHDRKGYKNFIVPACNKALVELKAQTTKYNEDGKIDPYDMPKFYHDIDCVIIASDMDGTPNQLLEAAATGRTFVGVRIGNVPEFYNGKNGFIVERNVDAIVKKINWLNNHPKERKEMGIEARKTIDAGWSWQIQARNYARMFEKILNNI